MKKKIVSVITMGALILSVALSGAGCAKKKAENGSLTIFNYGEYMDPDVIRQFTEETGIEIKYEEALTPEEMRQFPGGKLMMKVMPKAMKQAAR